MTYTAKNQKQMRTEKGSLMEKLTTEFGLIDDEIGFMNTDSAKSVFSKSVHFGTSSDAGGVALTDSNSKGLAVHSELPSTGTALSAGTVARGVWSRFLVNKAQTNDVSLYGVQGHMRVKANTGPSSAFGIWGYLEESGTATVSFGGGIRATVEGAATMTITKAYGVLVDAKVASGATISTEMAGIRIATDIEGAGSMAAWTYGMMIDGSCTTGISITGTITTAIAVTAGAAETVLNIDAGATDHTGANIITCDLDVNSANCKFINADIDVGTALSSGENVYGMYLDVDGAGGDDAASGITGIYLTSANTTGGVCKALSIAGTWDTAVSIGTSSAKLTLSAAASRLADVYSTSALTSGNTVTMTVSETMTGASGTNSTEVAQFQLTSNVQLGVYANAVAAKVDLSTAGYATGLVGVVCAELDMPGGAIAGGAGTYSCFEAELNMPTSFGGGVPISVMYVSAWGAQVAQFDTDGYLFDINGVTKASGKFFQDNNNTASQAIRIKVNGTPYYILLSSTSD